jgi:cytoskeletal protein RodZ
VLKHSKLTFLAVSLWATAVCAQSVSQPLNLSLPPDIVSSQNATAAAASARDGKTVSVAAAPAATTTAQSAPANATSPVPGYDEAANRTVDAADAANRSVDGQEASEPACTDAAYTQPQVHGSVGMGVVAGNRVSGNYQTGGVQVAKAFGSCDHPTGGASLSIDVGRGSFGNSRGWH